MMYQNWVREINAHYSELVKWITLFSMAKKPKLILASGSPRRLALLQQIGVKPDHVISTEIDESPKKSELPKNLSTTSSS